VINNKISVTKVGLHHLEQANRGHHPSMASGQYSKSRNTVKNC